VQEDITTELVSTHTTPPRIYLPCLTLEQLYIALQRYIRQLPQCPETLKYLFYKKNMTKFFKFGMTTPGCPHVACDCVVSIEGIHPTTAAFKTSFPLRSESSVLPSVFAAILNVVTLKDGVPKPVQGDPARSRYAMQALGFSQLSIPAPFRGGSFPMDRNFYSHTERSYQSLQQCDRRVWYEYGVYIDERVCRTRIFPRTFRPPERHDGSIRPVESLRVLAARACSWFRFIRYGVNDRPVTISAMTGLYPNKFADAVGGMSKETRQLPQIAAGPMKLLAKAQQLMYDKIGIHEFETEPSIITMKDLDGLYLGSSGGLEPPEVRNIRLNSGESIRVSSNGLKITKLESDLENVIQLIEKDIEFMVSYSNTPKDENFHYGGEKQADDAAWEKAQSKVRIFTVPNSPFLIANRLVVKIRHLKERGHICIGHKWPKGGMDRLAKLLGIDLSNCWKFIIVEGDIEKLDQSIWAIFVMIYYSFGLIHERSDSFSYLVKKKILLFILKNVCTRLTRVFAELWEILFGKVPSGVLDTSHMDSYIKLLWFFMFCVWVIDQADRKLRRDLSNYVVRLIAMIVYGDDFLYNKGDEVWATYFCGKAYKEWLMKFLQVNLRDLYDGISFCSKEHNGYLTHKGSSFLKMYSVLNPYKTDTNQQCNFLPYRETKEYVMRCFSGREPKTRDILDMLLSCMAHGYGTYASNPNAY